MGRFEKKNPAPYSCIYIYFNLIGSARGRARGPKRTVTVLPCSLGYATGLNAV